MNIPKKRGRKLFSPTKAQRNKVMLLVAAGFGEPSIADVIGICQNTLRKHFPEELRSGRDRKLAENLVRLDKAAQEGNVTAQKYLDGKLGAQIPSKQEPKPEAIGKKEALVREAHEAHTQSEWGDILH
jgi:hypothetical protein